MAFALSCPRDAKNADSKLGNGVSLLIFGFAGKSIYKIEYHIYSLSIGFSTESGRYKNLPYPFSVGTHSQ